MRSIVFRALKVLYLKKEKEKKERENENIVLFHHCTYFLCIFFLIYGGYRNNIKNSGF